MKLNVRPCYRYVMEKNCLTNAWPSHSFPRILGHVPVLRTCLGYAKDTSNLEWGINNAVQDRIDPSTRIQTPVSPHGKAQPMFTSQGWWLVIVSDGVIHLLSEVSSSVVLSNKWMSQGQQGLHRHIHSLLENKLMWLIKLTFKGKLFSYFLITSTYAEKGFIAKMGLCLSGCSAVGYIKLE